MPAPDRAVAPLVTADGWGYRHPGRVQWAVRDASFQLAPGSLTVLLGASGSGKSTLLAGLAGLLGAGDTSGSLTGPHVIGYVGQEPESNIVMERVGDDVAFPLENRAVPTQEIWARARRVLGEVGLADLELRDTATLSGGQTQLLSLAAALAPGPELLLLDEPTANLDPDAAQRVVNAVLAARQRTGCAVVVIEHRVAAWLDQADLVLLMVDGELTGLAPAQLADAVAESTDLTEHVWLGPPTRPARRASQPPGAVVLSAVGVAVDHRLVASDLSVRAGEVVALVGPPGSGKTTLLHVVAGLLRPNAGTVSLTTPEGALDQPWQWRAQQVSEYFGIVFQDPAQQFLTGSVSAELGHGLAVAGVPPDEAAHRVARMIDTLGLAGLGPVNPFTLSGGQARRLSVGTALIAAPRVLVLDEPTFGQDPGSWAAMAGIIADHRDGGGAVLLATHDPHLVSWLGAREVRLGDDVRSPAQPAAPAAGQLPPRAGLLRRLNPLALLAGAGILSAAALASSSVGTNLLLAATGIVLALLGGAPRRRLAALLAPAILAGVSAALSNAMLASGGVTQVENWQAAMLPATRIIAVAVPGLVAAVSIDPTALADSLTQLLRVPARPAYAVLAGLRLLPLLGAQWEILRRASRARGIAGQGLLGRAQEFVSVSFRMLVTALRRGTQLALALDARGLGAGPRTVARPQRLTPLDGLCLVACTGIVWGAWLA